MVRFKKCSEVKKDGVYEYMNASVLESERERETERQRERVAHE